MDNSLKQLLLICCAICIIHACSRKKALSSTSPGTTTDTVSYTGAASYPKYKPVFPAFR